MPNHKVGTREQWLAARLERPEREKELTRGSDDLARQRQELPLGAGREGIPLPNQRRNFPRRHDEYETAVAGTIAS
jgi:hypothetical protein